VAEAETDSKPGKRRADKGKPGISGAGSVSKVRSMVATAVWVAAVVCALFLAVGALLVALDMNRNNAIVEFVLNVANNIDFGVFKDFEPDVPRKATPAEVKDAKQSAETKSVMVNWGLAALIYLVVGKILDRLIRPRP
jgi:hypothetical protein